MINSIYLSMVLATGAVAGINMPATASADPQMPVLESRLHFNLPQAPGETVSSFSDNLVRMEQGEAVQPAANPIPEVVPAKKTAPVGYSCRLDSVTTEDNLGNRIQKEIFEFTEEGLPAHRIIQKWDRNEARWYDNKEFFYEYDSDGYLVKFTSLVLTGRGSSVTTYEYDSNHNITVELLSLYTDGETTPYQKAEYGWDQWNQCVEEHVYEYDSTTGEWNNVSWTRGELLPDGKTKWAEVYTWTGTKWKGKQRKNYDYNENGDCILFGDSVWLDDSDEWLYNYKFVRHYREDGQISLDETFLWNCEANDWSGPYEFPTGKVYNSRIVYTYDSLDRIISEEAYRQQENGDMVRGAATSYEYSEPEAGVSRKRMIRALCDETGEILRDHMMDEITDTNHLGEVLYSSQSETFNAWETVIPITEETFTYYDDDISLRDEEAYQWDGQGNKLYVAKGHYEYDEDMNCIQSDHWQGLGNPEWIPYSHFIYEYENGIRTRKYAYKYQGSTEPKPNWGDGWDWDFTVPFGKVLFWESQGDFPFKIDAMYSFYADGADWGYQMLKYYYSPLEDTSVDAIATSGVLRLEGRTLTAAAADAAIEVYDMTGRRVAQGLGSASLSELQAGIYVAAAGGDTLKFILR